MTSPSGARAAGGRGAGNVGLCWLEGYDERRMGEEDRSECERDGVAVYAGWGPREVSVEGGKAAGVSFVKCLKVKDENGRFAPVYDENTVQVAPCTTVLFCIGQKAEWRELLSGTAVEFDPNGTAKADPVTYQTAEADIFVGGDAFTGQKFAIDAIAAGKQGAVSLHRFVQGATLTIGRDRRQFIELDKKSALIAVDSYDNTPRQRVGYNEALRNTFRDERVAFTAQQVRAETARCLGCGASIVDPNKCIGCGVCTTKCAFDAIHLHRERPECSTMYACEDKMKAILPYMIKRSIKIKKAERRAKKAKCYARIRHRIPRHQDRGAGGCGKRSHPCGGRNAGAGRGVRRHSQGAGQLLGLGGAEVRPAAGRTAAYRNAARRDTVRRLRPGIPHRRPRADMPPLRQRGHMAAAGQRDQH